MITKVSKHGWTTVPAALRKRYGMHAGTILEWSDRNGIISIVLVDEERTAPQSSELRNDATPGSVGELENA